MGAFDDSPALIPYYDVVIDRRFRGRSAAGEVGRWGAIALLAGLGTAAAGCAPFPPAPPPVVNPSPCSPGWQMGADGTCVREPSNFGGPPINFGVQA
jgi:hypothetical protein